MHKFYLLGYPLSHSFSPYLYNRFFKILNVEAEYTLYETKKENLKERLEELMKDKDIKGFNLTQPLKEEILKFNLKLDEISKKINSVNCVKVEDYTLYGFNTDYFGFLKSLYPYKKEIESTLAVVLGAGGASKSIIYALKNIGVKKTFVANRTYEKAINLKEIFKDFILPIRLDEVYFINEKIKILVNTTTVGLKDEECLVDEKFIDKDMIVYDLIYNPKLTKLLKIAKEKGAKVKNGYTMLYIQCLENIRLWFNGGEYD
ncbi:MAG: shikimate dehydrogenase family protein [Caldisericia bacterium]